MINSKGILTEVLEDYEFIREVGAGNYAKVYQARSNEDGRTYAIKSIQKSMISQSERNLSALINKIDVMRFINHPGTLAIHRTYEDDKHIHLVLDYSGGGELFSRVIKRGKFSEQTAAQFAKNLLIVLDYLHSNGVVHRDLKPENILMKSAVDDTTFRVADFGLSSFIDAD